MFQPNRNQIAQQTSEMNSTQKNKTRRGIGCKKCHVCAFEAKSNSAKNCWKCKIQYILQTKKRSVECMQGRTTKRCTDCGKAAKSNRSCACIDHECGYVFKASKKRRIVTPKKKQQIKKKHVSDNKESVDLLDSFDMERQTSLEPFNTFNERQTSPFDMERQTSLESFDTFNERQNSMDGVSSGYVSRDNSLEDLLSIYSGSAKSDTYTAAHLAMGDVAQKEPENNSDEECEDDEALIDELVRNLL